MKKTLALLLALLMVTSCMVFTTAAEESATTEKVNFIPVMLQDDMDPSLTNWLGDWWTATDGSKFVLTYDETEKAAVRSWEGKQTGAGWVKFGYRWYDNFTDITDMAAICFDLYISDVDAMNVNKGGWELELRSPGGDDDNEFRVTSKNLATLYGGELQDGWNHFEIPLTMLAVADKADDGKTVDLTKVNYFRFFNNGLAADAAIGLEGETTTLKMRDVYFVDQLFYERPGTSDSTKFVTDFDGNGMSYSTYGGLKGDYASSIKDIDGDGDLEYAVFDATAETGDFLIGNGGWFSSDTPKDDPIWDYEGHGIKAPLTFNSSIDTSESFSGIMFDIYISDTKVDADASASTAIDETTCVNSLKDVQWFFEMTSYKNPDNQEIAWKQTFGNIFGQQIELGKWNTVAIDISTRDSHTDSNGVYVPTNTNFIRLYNASAFSYMGDLTIAIDNIRTVRKTATETPAGQTPVNTMETGNGIIWLLDEAQTNGRNKALRIEQFVEGKETAVGREYYANGFTMDATGMDTVAFDLFVNFYGASSDDASVLGTITQSVWNNKTINVEASSSGKSDLKEVTRKTSLAEMTGSATPVEGWFHVEFPISDFYKSGTTADEIDWAAVNFFTLFMESKVTMPAGLNLLFAIDNLYFKDSTYVAPAAPTPEARATGAALMLNDNFNLTYTVKTNDLIVSNPLVDVTYGGKTVRVDLTETAENTYSFDCTKILAHCLTETVQTTVKALTADGKVQKNVHEYSVKDYCARMLAREDVASEVKQLLSDTLRYGEAAQIYASYKLDSLATSHVTNMLDAPAFDVDNVGKLTTVLDGEYTGGAKWRSATLVLGSSMAIRYTFTAESLDGVSVACSNGQTYTSFASATDENGAAYYYFDVPVSADQFDTTFTVSFAGNESYKVNYSVNHYIATKYDGSLVKTAALLEAIYNYGVAADAYVAASAQ